MNVRATRFLASRWSAAVAAVVGLAALAAPAAHAVPVSVDLTGLMAAGVYNEKSSGDDQAYFLLTGSAKGKALEPAKLPKESAWTVARKKPAADAKKPVALWSGDLADGEFAVLTFTLFQGAGSDDAKLKAYAGQLAAAAKAVPAAAGAKLASPEEAVKLSTDLLKAQRAVVTDVKKTFSREAKTDHFGGQFTVLTWNNGGKVWNRVDPVGLTFGEHYGTKEKVYTKIKNTRQNVLVQDETGDWSEQALLPLNDEETGLRVKMLEAEKVGDAKKVTDYVAEVTVKADGKPVPWKLGGEEMGPSDIHAYWNFAETKVPKVKK
jgi:hypothetical protein